MEGEATLPTRPLGKTGLSVPALGLGTAQAGTQLADEDATRLFHHAIDLGVTFFDTAPGYGEAHRKLRPVLADRRQEVLLATKAPVDTAADAIASVEQSLSTMGVEQVDIVYVHSLGERNVDRVLAEDGALAGLREAQRRGLTRFVGLTSHNRPQETVRAIETLPLDVVMLAMNYADRYIYGLEDCARPLAIDRGVGVVAMKVFGGAAGMQYDRPRPAALADAGAADYPAAIRYALGLAGVATAVVGTGSLQELEQNVAMARACAHAPLHADSAAAAKAAGPGITAVGRSLADIWGDHFGPR